jgi:hypothetical protein
LGDSSFGLKNWKIGKLKNSSFGIRCSTFDIRDLRFEI